MPPAADSEPGRPERTPGRGISTASACQHLHTAPVASVLHSGSLPGALCSAVRLGPAQPAFFLGGAP